MKKPQKGARKIIVNSQEYWYFVGKSKLPVWFPDGKIRFFNFDGQPVRSEDIANFIKEKTALPLLPGDIVKPKQEYDSLFLSKTLGTYRKSYPPLNSEAIYVVVAVRKMYISGRNYLCLLLENGLAWGPTYWFKKV